MFQKHVSSTPQKILRTFWVLTKDYPWYVPKCTYFVRLFEDTSEHAWDIPKVKTRYISKNIYGLYLEHHEVIIKDVSRTCFIYTPEDSWEHSGYWLKIIPDMYPSVHTLHVYLKTLQNILEIFRKIKLGIFPRTFMVYTWDSMKLIYRMFQEHVSFMPRTSQINSGYWLNIIPDTYVAIRPRPAPWSARVMAPLVGSASRRRCDRFLVVFVSRGARLPRVSRCVWF